MVEGEGGTEGPGRVPNYLANNRRFELLRNA